MAVNKTSLFQSIALATLLIMGLTGCAINKPKTDPAMDKKARAMAMSAREYNDRITTSKGSGHLIIQMGVKKQVYKIAWAAQAPNRLRLTLLVSGHPVETIVASGEKVTFISHTGKHKPHSTLSGDPDLKSYIGLPVRLSQMVSMLLGQVPIRGFDRAWISPERPDLVHTHKNMSSHLQELKTDGQGQIKRYQILDKDLSLIFGVEFNEFKQKKHFSIPTALSLYDAQGRTLEITLTGIVPNAPVKDAIFRLTASGS